MDRVNSIRCSTLRSSNSLSEDLEKFFSNAPELNDENPFEENDTSLGFNDGKQKIDILQLQLLSNSISKNNSVTSFFSLNESTVMLSINNVHDKNNTVMLNINDAHDDKNNSALNDETTIQLEENFKKESNDETNEQPTLPYEQETGEIDEEEEETVMYDNNDK